jgi:hypothetical protein
MRFPTDESPANFLVMRMGSHRNCSAKNVRSDVPTGKSSQPCTKWDTKHDA